MENQEFIAGQEFKNDNEAVINIAFVTEENVYGYVRLFPYLSDVIWNKKTGNVVNSSAQIKDWDKLSLRTKKPTVQINEIFLFAKDGVCVSLSDPAECFTVVIEGELPLDMIGKSITLTIPKTQYL